jgi:hypothetical protein
MFSFSETAKDELLSAPTIPKRFLMLLLMMFPFLQPLLSAVSNISMSVHWVAVALCGSDFVMECVKRWSSGTLASTARVPRSTREKLEFLWRYTVDALRWLVICGVMVSVGFSFVASVLGLYTMYLIVWGRSLSHVGIVVRWVAANVLGFPSAQAPQGSDTAAFASSERHRRGCTPRTTSLKSGSQARCVVMDEGSLFNVSARGCLLGEC